jgi:signal transduction histidine kinase
LRKPRDQLELVHAYARYFDNAVTANAHRRLEVLEIRDVIGEFNQLIRPTLERDGVEFKSQIRGYELFTKPMHRSEWASIFLNVFTNSLKAIRRARRRGRLLLKAMATEEHLVIDFCDNGDGIALENRDRVFDAFFTTSSPPGPLASESDELTGTGLGLKIVRDVVESRDGEIFIADPPEGYTTCVRITLPRAVDEEVPDDVR